MWMVTAFQREWGREWASRRVSWEGGWERVCVWSRSNLPADGWRGERWRADRYYARQAPGTSAPTSTGSDADEQVALLTWQSSHSTPPPSHDPSSLEALQILCIFCVLYRDIHCDSGCQCVDLILLVLTTFNECWSSTFPPFLSFFFPYVGLWCNGCNFRRESLVW